MFDILKKAGRGIRKFMDEKVKTCEKILSSAKNRSILGIIIMATGVGLGGGLLISAYVPVPKV